MATEALIQDFIDSIEGFEEHGFEGAGGEGGEGGKGGGKGGGECTSFDCQFMMFAEEKGGGKGGRLGQFVSKV